MEESLAKYFCKDSRLEFSEFIRWSYRIGEFVQFFQIIDRSFTEHQHYQSDQYKSELTLSKRELEFKKSKLKQELFIE